MRTGSQLGFRATKQLERRVFALTFSVFVALFAGVYVAAYGAANVAYFSYQPRAGDVIFQSLPPSRLVRAIEGATKSPLSHCGIVARHDGQWMVLEAYDGVEHTPLREFVFRGRGQHFAVCRLKPKYSEVIPEFIAAARRFVGRKYDSRYRMDDEKIYCSELVYKAFSSATDGEQMGKLTSLGSMNWVPFEKTIRHYEGGPVPLDREIITPIALAQADQLQLEFAHRLSIR